MPSSIELAESLLSTLPAVAHALARATRDESEWDTHGMIQMRTLVMLKDGPKTFKDLCAFRGVAPPTLSRSVTAMVRRGWTSFAMSRLLPVESFFLATALRKPVIGKNS